MAKPRVACQEIFVKESEDLYPRARETHERLAVARVAEPLAHRALERERLAAPRQPSALALELGDVALELRDPRLARASRSSRSAHHVRSPESPSTSATTSAIDDDPDR
jgi:hypothetical protein